jgi:hypothetical protein
MVLDSFLAGLISVENSRLIPEACRFEKGVYDKLRQLRAPLKFWRRSWNGLTALDMANRSNEELIDFATSWGYTQMMGYWTIALSGVSPAPISIAALRDPEKHLKLAVRLLHLVALRQMKTYCWGDVLRIWNTGHPQGKTADPNYVANALAVMQEYRKIRDIKMSSPQ